MACGAVLLTTAPAIARVDSGTSYLIQTLNSTGVRVTMDNPEYCDGTVHGTYHFSGMKRFMSICTGDSLDARDHSTVRHETVHAIQHCLNVAYGRSILTPINTPNQVRRMARDTLSPRQIKAIHRVYPAEQHLIELEAFVLERTMTAAELTEHYRNACVG